MRRSGGGIGHAVSFPEGLEELPRALAEGMAAQRIAARATGLSRSGNEWRISLEGAGAASNVAAQTVVLAVPAAVAAGLLEPLAPAAAAALRAVRHASVAVACLGFQAGGAPLGIDLRGYGFLVARPGPPGAPKGSARSGAAPAPRENPGGPALLGCQYESSIFAGRAPPGGVLLRAILGGTFDPGFVDLPDDAIAARAIASLRGLAGLRREPDLVRIWRHRGAIPQYELGHAALVAATDAELRLHPGLHVIGNALRGVGLNDCIAAAAALARALPAG
jgi:oxygen-dependent protoporphyrinogen oxidase